MNAYKGKNEFFSTIWNVSPDPYWICRPEGDDFIVMALNPAAVDAFPGAKEGFSLAQALGSGADAVMLAFARCMDGKVSVTFDYSDQHAGRERYFRAVIVPISTAGGKVTRIWGTARELTDLLEARKRSEDLVQRLESEVRERTAMLLAANEELAIANVELKKANDRYQDLALKDALTGLANRRAFQEAGVREFSRAQRYGRGLALVLFDLDNLKRLNDEHGHPSGDEAIRRVGRVLAEASRGADLAARLGGDEFALILPETDMDKAVSLAKRSIDALSDELLDPRDPESPRIGASAGVAVFHLSDTAFDDLYARSDHALYRAKNRGKARVEGEKAG